jgi:hypothetical protein
VAEWGEGEGEERRGGEERGEEGRGGEEGIEGEEGGGKLVFERAHWCAHIKLGGGGTCIAEEDQL